MSEQSSGQDRKILIFVPGLVTGRDSTPAMLDLLREHYEPEWEIHVVKHGIRPWSLSGRLLQAVERLEIAVASHAGDLTGEGHTVSEVRLVGHSLGGLLVRAAYLRGQGIDGPPAAQVNNGWAGKVERIVLIGSPNQGFDPARMPLQARLAYAFASPFWDFAAESIQVGGYWLTNLRLRWMETVRSMDRPPLVIQLLGNDDRYVGGADSLDNEYMPNTGWTHMEGANHTGLVDLRDPATSGYRWKVLQEAIFGASIQPSAERPVSDAAVYFLVHGIRASSYENWVQALGRELSADAGATVPHVVAMNYDFLSAYEFALPFSRHRKTHAFLAAYGNACRDFSPDNFRFAGHSNGTYMMGRSMLAVPALRFRYIFLAGSVLPTSFTWSTLFARKQVGWRTPNGRWHPGKVHNDRAAIDVPVGILATFLHGLRPFNQDIGPGGYRGFSEVNLPAEVSDHAQAFPPGHGSALMDHEGYPPRMAQIATFLATGNVEDDPQYTRPVGFSRWSRAIQRLAWFLVLLVIAVLVVVFFLLSGIIGLTLASVIYAVVLATVYVLLRVL